MSGGALVPGRGGSFRHPLPRGELKPHVRHYLDRLKQHGVSVILIVNSDGPFTATGIDKINGLEGMFVRRNEGYDFAA